MVMFETATMRSGFAVQDSAGFASRVEKMLRMSLDIPLDEKVNLIKEMSLKEEIKNVIVQSEKIFYDKYSGMTDTHRI